MMFFRRRRPRGLPVSAPVWRAMFDLPLTNDSRGRVIRANQLVLDPALVDQFPEGSFSVAGYRVRDRVRLADDGPEWLFR